NGISYVFVLWGLLSMRLTPRPRPNTREPVLRRVREGFRYAWGFAPIRAILMLVAVVSLLGVPFSVLLPVIATETLGGGPRTLGLLMAAMGLGALTGALFLASRSTVVGLGRVIIVSAMMFGSALILLALARSILVAMPLVAMAGFGMMSQMASSNTVLQTLVDDDKRGRVMSLYTMSYVGMVPLGSLLIGWIASRTSAGIAIAAGGAVCMAAAFAFQRRRPVLRRMVRPIYRRLGILPEVARGIQAATHQATPETDES